MYGIARADKIVNSRVCHSSINAAFIRAYRSLKFLRRVIRLIVSRKKLRHEFYVLYEYPCITASIVTMLLAILITLIYDPRDDHCTFAIVVQLITRKIRLVLLT